MPEPPKPSWIPVAQTLQRHSGGWKASGANATLSNSAELRAKTSVAGAQVCGSDLGVADDFGSVTRTATFQQSQNIPK